MAKNEVGINDIKLNEKGFPILPERGIVKREGKVIKVSGKYGETRLKGFVDDPNAIRGSRPLAIDGVIAKHFGLPFHISRKIAREFVIFASIVKLRIYQSTSFCQFSEDDDRPGFKGILRDRHKEPTKQEIEEMKELEDFIMQTGRRDFKLSHLRKDRLPQFTHKLLRDVLALDRVALSIRRDRTGEIVDFCLIDPDTIKPVDRYVGYEDDKSIRYVQMVDGQVIETFKDGEIIVDWMHQTTDIEYQYYGWSGIEETFNEIKATIEGLKYNSGNFTQNRSPKGFFSTEADMEEEELSELEDRWAAIFSDPSKLFRVPFFAGDASLKFNAMGQTNKDMEYDNYMQLLISLLLINYSVDPEEIGLKLNKSVSIFGEKDTQSKQDKSKDRGLGALLDFETRVLNQMLETSPKYNKYILIHTGRKNIDHAGKLELDTKRLGNFETLYETRKQNDMPQLHELVEELDFEDEKEKEEIIKNLKKDSLLILSPQYLQGRTQPQQEGMGMGMEGEEGEEEEGYEGEEEEGEEEEMEEEDEGDFEELDEDEMEGEEEEEE